MKGLHYLPVGLAAATVLGAAALVTATVLEASEPPSGPVAIVWDRETCAHCRMHIDQPTFVAQIQTTDGRILNFDDPGCALQLAAEHELDVHAMFFGDCREGRWLKGSETAFIEVAQSPMGFCLGAVPAGTPDSIPMSDARARVLRRR